QDTQRRNWIGRKTRTVATRKTRCQGGALGRRLAGSVLKGPARCDGREILSEPKGYHGLDAEDSALAHIHGVDVEIVFILVGFDEESEYRTFCNDACGAFHYHNLKGAVFHFPSPELDWPHDMTMSSRLIDGMRHSAGVNAEASWSAAGFRQRRFGRWYDLDAF